MSGDDIPYQLRPNKFIDRQMFIESLSRLVVPRGPEKYVYISMGGRHLIDHYAVYNKLGIQALFSFDVSRNEVARQKFNRPTSRAVCVEMDSADLPSRIDAIIKKFPGKRNIIVWLDYTGVERRTQFQEMVQTLIRLQHGDIFRITLNADHRTLNPPRNELSIDGVSGPAQRAKRLRDQIYEYLPTDVESVTEESLPTALARSVELAMKEAEALNPSLHFKPVLITSYKDGLRMLTVTCAASETGNSDKFPTELFKRWKFSCRGWDNIQFIYSPVLSLKEQYRLDATLDRGPTRMLSALKFLPERDRDQSLSAIKSYRLLHRYYPTFRHIEE